METSTTPTAGQWPGWQKVLFRFFFIWFLLVVNPIGRSPSLPGWKFIKNGYDGALNWSADLADRYLFHIHPAGVPLPVNDGAGDTSHFWAKFWMFLLLSMVGCIVWTLLDGRRKNYERLGYWLRTGVRYSVACYCFQYGIMKLFMLQMSAPNLSELATPLGDYGPMRLCWMYMGYSGPYEMFAGMMEVTAGLLLIYRRTVTLGLLAALGVFINVMTMNLTFDIPVKGFSMELAISCMFLLLWDYRRLVSIFVLNTGVGGTPLYQPPYSSRRIRIARLLLKLYFVYAAIGDTTYSWGSMYNRVHRAEAQKPIHKGVYAVSTFVVNGDTIRPSFTDSTQWRDVIFDKWKTGSINVPDTSFTLKYGYGRGLFHYELDTVAQMLTMEKSYIGHDTILQCHYQLPDSNRVILRGRLHQDSVYIVLIRTNRQFQLSHWQFHWVSESNR
jgi:hypothetical protein